MSSLDGARPRWAAAFVRALLIGVHVALASLAAAGHYEVVYSGGGPTQITGPNGTPWTSPYSGTTNPNGRGGGGVSSNPPNGNMMGVAGPGSVSCSGAITATLSWTADGPGDTEPPPKSVVLKKSASASWSGDGGSCSSGLQNEQTYSDESSGSASAIEYEVVTDPGNSLTRSCSPSASSHVANPPQNDVVAASAGVNFKVIPIVIRVNVAGVWTNPNDSSDKRVLVG